jgi:hypothetical protein
MFSFSRSRMAMRRSKTFSQSVLRAKLSSVMKKRLMPCSRLLRTIRSMSSEFRRQLGQHRQATGDVKTADAYRHSGGAKGTRQIHGVRKLIGLHSYEGDHAASAAKLPGNAFGTNAGVGFIEGADHDLDIFAQHAAIPAVERQAIQNRQRIRRNSGTDHWMT